MCVLLSVCLSTCLLRLYACGSVCPFPQYLCMCMPCISVTVCVSVSVCVRACVCVHACVRACVYVCVFVALSA